METTSTSKISTVDALWALYQAQSKRVRKAFYNRLLAEEQKRKEEKEFATYINSKSFIDHAERVKQEYQEGKGVTLQTPDEIENYLNSL